MVDTADSKSANASCGGSSPPAGTTRYSSQVKASSQITLNSLVDYEYNRATRVNTI